MTSINTRIVCFVTIGLGVNTHPGTYSQISAYLPNSPVTCTHPFGAPPRRRTLRSSSSANICLADAYPHLRRLQQHYSAVAVSRDRDALPVRTYVVSFHIRSNIAAIPCPPPMHIVTRAKWPSIRTSSWIALVTMMAPVAPTGWPSDIPDPLGFTLLGSRSS